MTISIKPTASGSTIEQDGSTILTVDGSGNIAIANDLSVTGNVPANTGPAFSAYQSSSQSINSGAYYKTNFQSEFFDTDDCYDTTNSRFLPTVAGYYYVSATIMSAGPTGHHNAFAVNGTIVRYGGNISNLSTYGVCNTSLIYLNGSTDYVEYYTLFSGNQTINVSVPAASWFCGNLVRAA